MIRRLAQTFSRWLLWLYPAAFRHEVGAPLLNTVARQADAKSGREALYWLVRHTVSLLFNLPGAWYEALSSGGLRSGGLGDAPDRPLGELHTGGGSFRSFSWLDLKLGARMVVKQPGLSLVGGVGIAVAIGVAAGFFAFIYQMAYPTIPLNEADRMVGLENWDLRRNNEERRSLHDFVIWRDEMRTVEDMTAWRTVRRNLRTGDGASELVAFAEMSGSGFELARVPPQLGRTLGHADSEPGAPDVMVIGYDVWQGRFGGDPNIVGRQVLVGRVPHTVVGVMPRDFAFPVNHSYWLPFRERPDDHPVGAGPTIFISGRLAPGFELGDAKAELDVIGRRTAVESPETHGRLRPQVMPYILGPIDMNENGGEGLFWEFASLNAFIALVLLVVGLNVAVLVYARTATRRGEISIRTALGATRSRVVGQLFWESLVLALASALVGLLIARAGLGFAEQILQAEMGEPPFWLDLGLPAMAFVYVGGLAVMTAVVMGVLPGLQATGRQVQDSLRQFHGGTGLRLGRTWTTLIIVQVAATVAAIPVAAGAAWDEIAYATNRPGYDVDRFLRVWLATDAEDQSNELSDTTASAGAARLIEIREELFRRLEELPQATEAFPASDVPGRGRRVLLQVDAQSGAVQPPPRPVRISRVHPDFFGGFELPLIAGRTLRTTDLDEGAADVLVVDRTFAELLLGGMDGVGRRVRIAQPSDDEGSAPDERWFQVVGIVENAEANLLDPELLEPTAFSGLREESADRLGVFVKGEGGQDADLISRIREIVSDLDPTVRVMPIWLSDLYVQNTVALRLVGLMLVLTTTSVLLLSAGGIYALMSFAVSQRRREIGIRSALGARQGALLRGTFGRSAMQLTVGVIIGLGLLMAAEVSSNGEAIPYEVPLVGAVVLLVVVVGLLATLGPARKGLGISPAEALQGD